MEYKLHNGSGNLCCKGCSRQDNKLNTYDWLADIPGNAEENDMVEVQFKNTRKGYYRNSNKIKLEKGDIVAVEAAPGHDIGVVTLTGRLVPLQMKKANFKSDAEIKRIYRKAKPVDMEKFNEAKSKEHATMIRARQIALSLDLNMKIGDVEYQGDGNKAIFYYIADERVDFRQLIKVLAEAFRVRIEMKQIGARQEAGRIGGIGPCGRELCCATWMTSFVSVSTSAARFQDISLNPQKLAGQCAKLKCCLNYEVDCYVEAQKRLPSKEIELETKDATFYYFKADILSNQISYSTDKSFPANLVTISGKRAFEVIAMNRKGIKPDSLLDEERKSEPKKPIDLLEQESVTRFDRNKNKENGGGKRNKKKKKDNNNRPQSEMNNSPKQGENNRTEKENRSKGNRNKNQNQDHNKEDKLLDKQEEVQNQERQQKSNKQERNQNTERQLKQDKTDRNQNQERQPKQDKTDRNQNQERQPKQDKTDRNQNQERQPKQDKTDRNQNQERQLKQDKTDRNQNQERQPKQDKTDRNQNQERQPKQDKTDRIQNQERQPKQDKTDRNQNQERQLKQDKTDRNQNQERQPKQDKTDRIQNQERQPKQDKTDRIQNQERQPKQDKTDRIQNQERQPKQNQQNKSEKADKEIKPDSDKLQNKNENNTQE